MLDAGGQDATEAFEDVGHSDEAREILEGLKIGTLKRMVSDCLLLPIGDGLPCDPARSNAGELHLLDHELYILFEKFR